MGDQDKWWAAEEAKWKQELASRRNEDASNNRDQHENVAFDETQSNEGYSQVDDELEHENDICLKTQVVSKTPEDQGLGVQLYSPSDEHGVRIRDIVPDGPFGRTNSFNEGDVIVEINGIPLLYAGHESVFETIKNEMISNGEMSVTVCSPGELLKLEALVKNEHDTQEEKPAASKANNYWK